MKPVFDYDAHYRWTWLNRGIWSNSFREWKSHSSKGFIDIVKKAGASQSPVLDCSCGFGMKTIVIREAGLKVDGSDISSVAIEKAKHFCKEQGHPEIRLFRSSWKHLPEKCEKEYAAIFNDALSYIYEDREMEESLIGIHDALRPGGFLVYFGALPHSEDSNADLLEETWEELLENEGKYRLGFHACDNGFSVDELTVIEKGADYIDKHHLYLIQGPSGNRKMEPWTLRMSQKWHWKRIEPFLKSAGFERYDSREFTGMNGHKFSLVIAYRD